MILPIFFVIAVISLFGFSQIIRAKNREKNVSTELYRGLRNSSKDLQAKFNELRTQYTREAKPKRTLFGFGKVIKDKSWLDKLLKR